MSDPIATIHSAKVPLPHDARIIGVIGFGHLVSHFFHLIVAPLFPWLREEFAYSYAELGFLMTVFFTVSGGCQIVAGFVVDRYGAGGTLVGGLLCLSLAAIGLSVSNTYAGLVAASALAGLGNSVFHPVDFSLLNSRVSEPRLGSAYAVHGLTGSLGWACAPIFLVGLAAPFGWRVALMGAAVIPLLVIALLLVNRDVITVVEKDVCDEAEAPAANGSALGFLRHAEIWWCFAFFVFVSAAIGAAQSFAPSIFSAVYALDVERAAMSVTVMMLGSALGMGVGGWLVVKSADLERNITIALFLAGFSAVCVGLGVVSAAFAITLMGLMGFGLGLSGPSRDMLIRTATPVGATGRVYGVVYSGLDAGIALAPVIFGQMLDAGYFSEVFFGVALCMLLSIMTAWKVGLKQRPV